MVDIPEKEPVMNESRTILLVEDSRFFGTMVKRRIEQELDLGVVWLENHAETRKVLDDGEHEFMGALLDLTLPDAPNGEVVQTVLEHGIPVIIFTGGFSGEWRDRFPSWNIVDYILKDSPACVDIMIVTLKRLRRNRKVTILVVDDSQSTGDAVAGLLQTHMYRTLRADDGREALEVVAEHPEIRMVITDYQMPNMDGFELVRALREQRDKDDLAIIGMSAADDPLLSARFIKSGASDFLAKPFQVEEFHCRVDHNVDLVEQIALIRDLSNRDHLTRLFNRRYLFDNADRFFRSVEAAGQSVCVSMIDIDHFKSVNDTYGHDAGDVVLRQVAELLTVAFAPGDMVCRFGGEEFCVLSAHGSAREAPARLESLRRSVERAVIPAGDDSIRVTASIGCCTEPDELDNMIKVADQRLYQAKETGRNKVVSG